MRIFLIMMKKKMDENPSKIIVVKIVSGGKFCHTNVPCYKPKWILVNNISARFGVRPACVREKSAEILWYPKGVRKLL